MQTASVNLLPVDPAPAHDRREPADRGFADYLRRDEPPAAKADPRPAAPANDRRDAPATEKAAEQHDRPDDRAERTETAAREASEPVSTETDPDAAPADTVSETDRSESTAAPTATPAAAMSPAGKSELSLSPVSKQPANGTGTDYMSPAETAPSGGTASAKAQSAAADLTAGGPSAATGAEGTAKGAAATDTPAMPGEAVAQKITQAPVTAAPPSATEQAPVPVQPATADAAAMSATPEAAATAAAVATPVVSAATGTTRQTAGAAPSSSPATATAGPATAASGEEAASAATRDDTGANASVKPADGVQGQNKAVNGTAQAALATQPDEQAARTAPSDPITASMETGPRAADAPPQGQPPSAGGQTGASPTSFAGDLRLATGTAPSPDAAARPAPAPTPVVNQMAVQISRAVTDGQDKLTIDLKPATLGRVSVSLELGHDHRVIAVISADRADTLDLLQRDARTLERALQDAGLKTDSGSLSFSLNGDGAKESPAEDAELPGQFVANHPADDEADAPPIPHNPYSSAVNLTGIDIHV